MSEEKHEGGCCGTTPNKGCCGTKKLICFILAGILFFIAGMLFAKSECGMKFCPMPKSTSAQ